MLNAKHDESRGAPEHSAGTEHSADTVNRDVRNLPGPFAGRVLADVVRTRKRSVGTVAGCVAAAIPAQYEADFADGNSIVLISRIDIRLANLQPPLRKRES